MTQRALSTRFNAFVVILLLSLCEMSLFAQEPDTLLIDPENLTTNSIDSLSADGRLGEPFRSEENISETQQDALDNLQIQRRMADAAEKSANWSKFQFFAGAIAGIVLIVTLYLNVVATRAASRSAQAAVENVKLSGRGHLGIEKFTFHRSTWNTEDEKGVRGVHIVATIANRGNAPVIVTRTVVSTRVVEDGNIESIDWAEDTESPEISIHIGPNTTTRQAPLVLNLLSLKKIYNDELRVLYMLRFRYKDMFTESEYHTDSCFELNVYCDPQQLLDESTLSLSQHMEMQARGEFGSAS